ncbi:claspin-like isoform X2 [Stylophora pistillata]|uniref:claspin-like isoform X2 n=1 Tax=Stylophora pistillata TaxID=50429 RepID=UPI000C057770|nr:claspin-like isoform X2 [Stylophora pistillata]
MDEQSIWSFCLARNSLWEERFLLVSMTLLKMPGAVDVLQQFANDDLFDAELGEDSDGGRDGNFTDNESAPKSPAPERIDRKEEDSSGGEAANGDSGEDNTSEKKKKHRRRESRKKSPRPRKAKKAELMSMHSETQRMVRESIVKLPYHLPAALPIAHFLKRVPLTDQKNSNSPRVVSSGGPLENQTSLIGNGKPDDQEHASPLIADTASPTAAAGAVKVMSKAATPKLSAATDPFFLDLDADPPMAKPLSSGVQSLKDRFLKHTFKPQDKSATAKKLTERKDHPTEEVSLVDTPKPKGVNPVLSNEKLMTAKTPGSRLQLLKEQLQKEMRVKRAENRKIQESQRKLDNEEMSEEEEEEEEMTDEEDDSDYELDKWNEDDEQKQEEGGSEVDGEDGEDKEVKDKNDFLDDEADESDHDDFGDGRDDVDSGSEGDVSDDGENDNSADENSAFSDDEFSITSLHSLKKKQKQSLIKESIVHSKEETMDLFCDSRSRGLENDGSLEKNSNNEKGTGESVESLCLRLDSLEDGDDTNFNFPSSPVSSKMKAKMKNVANISEASQESSQSSFGVGLGSEFGENANSLEASSDSSVIPPGEGDSRALGDRSSGKKTPEIFSSFSRVRNLIGIGNYGDTLYEKKSGKLSQLTLPIEDSQDLFDHGNDRNVEDNNSQQLKTGSEPMSSDFHFSLDEDTQFTQILNTQGFLNSSKKSQTKTKNLFNDKISGNTQPAMKELLGLCSGRFSDNEDSEPLHNTETQNKTKGQRKSLKFDTQSKQCSMNELLDLCSGKFSDDDNGDDEIGEVLERQQKGSEQRETEVGQEEDKIDVEDNDEKRDKESDDDNEESDPEEMILKRKNVFDKRNFLEEEAELSGSDVGSDEDEDIATDDDVLDEESGGEDLPSDEELQKQINKVHMKSIHDQDNVELRAVKEMFLPDGDLYSDGQGRTRHFRWRGIDENSQFNLFGDKGLWGDEEGEPTELSTEEEIQRRKERYERETFLREELEKKKESNMLDLDENSQNILNKIKDTSSQLPEAPVKPQAIILNYKNSVAPVSKKKTSFKGSFLKHNKTTLSRLSSLTSNAPNASATTRGFVFHTVSPSGKNNSNAKKLQRTNSAIELPASKKPRLDRALSDSTSVFSML